MPEEMIAGKNASTRRVESDEELHFFPQFLTTRTLPNANYYHETKRTR